MKKALIGTIMAVLLLCTVTSASAQTAVNVPAQNNIVQVVGSENYLKTFAGAIDRAGMRDTLMGTSPYTVFAPTDDAFNRVPPNTLNAILADPAKTTALVKNHVVQGRYDIKDLANMGLVTSLDSKTFKITSAGTAFAVDGAHIVKNDIPAGNGIIHVIDTVMIPK